MQITYVSTRDIQGQFALLVLENRREIARLEEKFLNLFTKKSEPNGSLFGVSNLNYFNRLSTDCEDWFA